MKITDETERQKKTRKKQRVAQAIVKVSSIVNEGIRTILDLFIFFFFFSQEDFTHTQTNTHIHTHTHTHTKHKKHKIHKKHKKHKTLTSDFPPLRCFLCP